eukprot:GHRQ01019505.1.p1 GENE.GHRQ01019505.1~~GHRQ01019505.1.p1  ORF type:complete len:197 (+),score=25.82 GHRQ01019505.1:21-611(+)
MSCLRGWTRTSRPSSTTRVRRQIILHWRARGCVHACAAVEAVCFALLRLPRKARRVQSWLRPSSGVIGVGRSVRLNGHNLLLTLQASLLRSSCNCCLGHSSPHWRLPLRCTLFCCAVIANMRGESPEAVATLLMQQEGLRGLQGPTISPVYSLDGSNSGAAAKHGFYACVICVAKKNLYSSVKALQKVRGWPGSCA